MRPFLCCLLVSLLVAQEPAQLPPALLDLQTDLGSDPAAGIQVAPRGCWDGLLFGAVVRPPPRRPTVGEATVEVWDLLPPSRPRQEAFSLYLGSLRERLSRAFAQPPPKLQALELSEIMLSDPSNPQKLDLTKVKSMQDRFNRLPPNGSPVK